MERRFKVKTSNGQLNVAGNNISYDLKQHVNGYRPKLKINEKELEKHR